MFYEVNFCKLCFCAKLSALVASLVAQMPAEHRRAFVCLFLAVLWHRLPCPKACGILVPDQGLNLVPWVEGGFFTNGPPWMQSTFFLKNFFRWWFSSRHFLYCTFVLPFSYCWTLNSLYNFFKSLDLVIRDISILSSAGLVSIFIFFSCAFFGFTSLFFTTFPLGN